jgi:hypothetical protein
MYQREDHDDASPRDYVVTSPHQGPLPGRNTKKKNKKHNRMDKSNNIERTLNHAQRNGRKIMMKLPLGA